MGKSERACDSCVSGNRSSEDALTFSESMLELQNAKASELQNSKESKVIISHMLVNALLLLIFSALTLLFLLLFHLSACLFYLYILPPIHFVRSSVAFFPFCALD